MQCEKHKAFGFIGCEREATVDLTVEREWYGGSDQYQFVLCDKCLKILEEECLTDPALTIVRRVAIDG